MEAMYVGLPIIATDCRGQRDLVQNGFNGYLIPQNDKEKFIYSVKQLLNKDIYNKFLSNNKDIVRQYLLDDILIKMNEIYEGVLK